MTCPSSYRNDCVPRALAALTGQAPEEAASQLWPLRSLWMEPYHRPPQGEGEWGTPLLAAADAAVRLGWGVELWSGDGTFRLDALAVPYFLSASVEERIHTVRRLAPSADADESDPDPTPPAPDWLTVQEWGERLRVGRWIIGAIDPTGTGAHALAFAGGKVVTGDTADLRDHAHWRVFDLLRLIPPPPS